MTFTSFPFLSKSLFAKTQVHRVESDQIQLLTEAKVLDPERGVAGWITVLDRCFSMLYSVRVFKRDRVRFEHR